MLVFFFSEIRVFEKIFLHFSTSYFILFTVIAEKGIKLGLYGAGAVKTIKGGTGSGDVNIRATISIYEGLVNAGVQVTSESWLKQYEEYYEKARLIWKEQIPELFRFLFEENTFLQAGMQHLYIPVFTFLFSAQISKKMVLFSKKVAFREE